MSQPDPETDLYCPDCGDQVPAGELVSLTGHPDLCAICADEVLKHQPEMQLWDHYGTPRLPHVPCPRCGDSDEVGSHFDVAWCYSPGCGWRGSLTEMRRPSGRPRPFGTVSIGYVRDVHRPLTLAEAMGIAGVTTLCAIYAFAVFSVFWWAR